jgi:2-oxoglutarate dehydrogenase C-terminal
VLSDPLFADQESHAKVQHLCFVSGKLYYDLIKQREALKMNNVAFIRLEELNPFPVEDLREEISKFKNIKEFYWVQEGKSSITQNLRIWVLTVLYSLALTSYFLRLLSTMAEAHWLPLQPASARYTKKSKLTVSKVYLKL